jgi:hypothetical protein
MKQFCWLAMSALAACSTEVGDEEEGERREELTLPRITARELAAGYVHNCLVDSCGKVRCWGRNDWGQTNAPASGTYTHVAAGNYHSCAIRSNGSITCWGDNRMGQRNSPATGRYVSIHAGYAHTCAVRDDHETICWGWAPGSVVPASASESNLAVGGNGFSCAQVLSPGLVSLECWGANAWNQASPPTVAFDTYGSPRQTSLGYVHGCTVTGVGSPTGRDGSSGRLLCWGYNGYGAVDGTGLLADEPETAVAFELEDDPGIFLFPPSSSGGYGFKQVAAGGHHTCAINDRWKADEGLASNVLCWGWSGSGATTPPAADFVHLSAGYSHTCGIDTNGDVQCWGSNTYGQLDDPALGRLCVLDSPPVPTFP